MKIKSLLLLLLLFLFSSCAKTPEQVIALAKKKMLEAKSCHYLLNLSSTFAVQNQVLDLRLSTEGDLDDRDKFSPSFQSGLEFSFKLGGEEELGFLIGGELKGIKDTLYLKPDKLELPPQLLKLLPKAQEQDDLLRRQIFALLSGLKGQWLKFDLTEIRQKVKLEQKLNPEKQKDLIKEARQLILSSHFAAQVEKPEMVEYQGKPCYHLKVTLDKAKLLEFYRQYFKLLSKHLAGQQEPPADFAQAEKQLQDFLNKTKELELELWIGKKDYYIYGLKTVLEFVPSPLVGSIYIPLEASLSDFNQELEIPAPQGAKTLLEMLPKQVLPFPFPLIKSTPQKKSK